MCTELAASLISSLIQLATSPCTRDGVNATKDHMKVLHHLKLLLKLCAGTGDRGCNEILHPVHQLQHDWGYQRWIFTRLRYRDEYLCPTAVAG